MLNTMKSPFTLPYLELLSYVLAMLNRFNCIFLGETPLLHKVNPQEKICSKRPLQQFFRLYSVLDIDHTNQKLFVSLQQIYLGVSTSETLQTVKKDKNIAIVDINKFYQSCLDFYIELVSQIKRRFDFSDPVYACGDKIASLCCN